MSFSMLYFSMAWVAQSTASCCMSSDMSAFLITAFLSVMVEDVCGGRREHVHARTALKINTARGDGDGLGQPGSSQTPQAENWPFGKAFPTNPTHLNLQLVAVYLCLYVWSDVDLSVCKDWVRNLIQVELNYLAKITFGLKQLVHQEGKSIKICPLKYRIRQNTPIQPTYPIIQNAKRHTGADHHIRTRKITRIRNMSRHESQSSPPPQIMKNMQPTFSRATWKHSFPKISSLFHPAGG